MKKTLLFAAFVTVFILGITASVRHGLPVAHADDDEGNIVGLWDVAVQVTSPEAFGFDDLIAFNQGGTLFATSTAFNAHTSEVLPLPLGVDTSDGYGVWAGEGDKLRVKFTRLLFAGSNAGSPDFTLFYGPGFTPGMQVGTNVVEGTGVLRGDTLSGTFTTQFLRLDGTVVLSGGGTFTASRAPRP